MRLMDGIFFTLVSTVICVVLPKLLSVTLSNKKPQSVLTKKFAIESADSHIPQYDVAAERVEWVVESEQWEDEQDVALASYSVGDKK